MRIQTLSAYPYEIQLKMGQSRSGALIHIKDENGENGWGDVAPHPRFSKESLQDCLDQLSLKKSEILNFQWNPQNFLHQLKELSLYPSSTFGLESALFSILKPLPNVPVPVSAFLQGPPDEIIKEAELRYTEGFKSAKLKVSNLSFEDAQDVIFQLKDKFRLRIDVNRAWKNDDSMRFFSQFSKDAFDYIEEPFNDPKKLGLFSHPFAVDESFPGDVSLEELETFPNLKAIILKPTIQGGLIGCLPLQEWAIKKNITPVIGSTFESDVGHMLVGQVAHRMGIKTPVGIGTWFYLIDCLGEKRTQFLRDCMIIPATITPSKWTVGGQ